MSGTYMSGAGALDEGKQFAIDVNCRSVLHAAWPLAEPGRIDAALDVLRPYMAELATTGEYDRAVVERVGRQLRDIFGTGSEHLRFP
jgi:hypothetical protein